MTPPDLALDDTFAFISRAIAGRRRVLEVGCGKGELAARLLAAGYEVTALDRRVHDPVVEVIERDFLEYEGGPFDAILFTSSLHHIVPLADAVARARAFLAPDGLLVLEEFDVAAPDDLTARWFYEMQTVLAAAGLLHAHRLHGSEEQSPLDRWRAEHDHTPPLHTGAAMFAAIGPRFTPHLTTRGAYLFRYICAGLEDDERGVATARAVFEAEHRRLAAGALKPVGVRLVARPR